MAFKAHRIDRSASFVLDVPPEAAFPLFEPEGERAWAEGWNPRYLVPDDGRTQQGMVFTTGEGAEATLWLMTCHDIPRRRVEYVRVTPATRMGTVTVTCAPLGTHRTEVTVRYVLTALNEAGNAFLETIGEAEYAAFIDSWRTSIGKLLVRGGGPVAPD